MSYYTGLSLVSMREGVTIPAPADQQLQVTGIPAGHWINYVTWAKDGRTIAFTTRSAGVTTAVCIPGHTTVLISQKGLLPDKVRDGKGTGGVKSAPRALPMN